MKTLLLTAIAVIVLLGCNKPNKPDNPLSLEEVKTFDPFMDLRAAILGNEGPRRVGVCQATFYADEPRIYFFRDMHYFIVKRRTHNVGK